MKLLYQPKMHYHRNKKFKWSNKYSSILVFFILLLVSVLFFGRTVVLSLKNALEQAGGLVWVGKNKISVVEENELERLRAEFSNHNTLLHENLLLKEIFYRSQGELQLAAVLVKPNQSPYDTLIIDLGATDGLILGQNVFAHGNILIGRVSEVYDKTAKVVLFSTPGEKTDALISGHDVLVQAIGRGGQNFEIVVPQGILIEKGTEIVLPGITPYIFGTVEEIISDPREPFQKLLLRSPINIFEIKFVEIEK